MTDDELRIVCGLSDRDIADLRLLIRMTERAESLGFKIDDKAYLPDGTYFGVIFRFFSLKESTHFFDDKYSDEFPDFFINAHNLSKKGKIEGKIIDGEVEWE